MKLDPTVLRTMSAQDFRVMEAIEKGMKDHELVPMRLISSIANLRHGGTHKMVSSLLRDKLLSHERKKNGFDGYRLTNAGYDILALHSLKVRGFIVALGQKIGTGKESDIYLACDPAGGQLVLKFHRLGRTSFRNVKKKRDYFGKASQQAHSWLFLSRLSAMKEFAFMRALHDVKYPTPLPIAHSRHVVAMSLVRGVPLYQIFPKQISVEQSADVYMQAQGLASRLAKHGLVHCDLNEFNLMVDLSGIQALATTADDPYVRHSGKSVAGDKSVGALSKPAWEQSLEANDKVQEALPEPIERLENGEPKPVVTLIDFPQMISTKHPNTKEYYERDLGCLRRFFELKLLCRIPDDADVDVAWANVANLEEDFEAKNEERLDHELRASGFNDQLNTQLELYYFDDGPKVIPGGVDGTIIEEQDCSDTGEPGCDNDDAVELADLELTHPVFLADQNSDAYNPQVVVELSGVEVDGGIEVDGCGDLKSESNQSIMSAKTLLSREEIEEHARNRVRRQIEEQRRKSRKHGAFKKKNSNKSYTNGRRLVRDTM